MFSVSALAAGVPCCRGPLLEVGAYVWDVQWSTKDRDVLIVRSGPGANALWLLELQGRQGAVLAVASAAVGDTSDHAAREDYPCVPRQGRG